MTGQAMDRDELGRKIVETSQMCAEGYRCEISPTRTNRENKVSAECATAASNTGWYMLQAFGFSNEEKKALFAAYMASK